VRNFEADHLLPLCAGGANDLRNLWPQPRGVAMGAETKDRLEWEVCAKIYRDHDDAELRYYQSAFMHDWIALYRREFGDQ
jgi:hypothetical protein